MRKSIIIIVTALLIGGCAHSGFVAVDVYPAGWSPIRVPSTANCTDISGNYYAVGEGTQKIRSMVTTKLLGLFNTYLNHEYWYVQVQVNEKGSELGLQAYDNEGKALPNSSFSFPVVCEAGTLIYRLEGAGQGGGVYSWWSFSTRLSLAADKTLVVNSMGNIWSSEPLFPWINTDDGYTRFTPITNQGK